MHTKSHTTCSITGRWIVGFAALLTSLCSFGGRAAAVSPEPYGEPATSSLMVKAEAQLAGETEESNQHALRAVSMFAITSPESRAFQKHDLIQIVVRETSRAKSTHELSTDKEYNLKGKVAAWPDLQLRNLRDLMFRAGQTTDLPALDLKLNKEFEGDGEYERRDDLTARLTAEVIEVLPNGNLVLEARSHIKTDEEESTIKITGMCRPQDVTAANTILSSQLHDLTIDTVHKGELKKSNEKGIIAKVLDTLFAF